MEEPRPRHLQLVRRDGRHAPLIQQEGVRVVPRIKIQNSDFDRTMDLGLGDAEPELATALTPGEARTLAEALVKHAEAREPEAPRTDTPRGEAT